MPRLREIIYGTSLTSTCWGNLAIRVYFQDTKGGIREFRNTWSGGTAYDRKCEAKSKSPLAIAQWMHHGRGFVRLYCLDTDNVIQEHCCDGGDWFSGDLTNSGVVAAPYSKLAVIRWDTGIRVYYQTNDDIIHEHCQIMGNWRPGAVLPTPSSCKPLRGTSIASTSCGGDPLFVYFQDEKGGIREIKHEHQWSVSGVICQAKPYTPLAVVQWNGKNRIRLYYLDKDDIIHEHCWNGSGWFPGALTRHRIAAAPSSKLAAVRWDLGHGGDIRVYYQPANDTSIHEYCISSHDWYMGAVLAVTQPGRSQEVKPVDVNGATYPTGFLPWVLDHTQIRDYDPSGIDGAGMIIGFMDGRIIAEDLRTGRCTALKPNDEGTSYTWVYKPEHAILYKLRGQDNKDNFVRHGQPGSGMSVTCSGEFRINQANQIESWIVTTNDGSGYHNPRDGECLGGVIVKLAKLGIETEGICWFYGSQRGAPRAAAYDQPVESRTKEG